jgi:tape measure domain-containing protein
MASRKGIRAGRAYVEAWLDDSAVGRGLKRLRQRFDAFAFTLTSIGSKAIAFSASILALLGAPLKRAAMLEMLEADFAVLLGSVSKAKQLLLDFRNFAKETPLEFIDIAESGKQLLNWKLATERNVIEVLRKIGDAAGGIPDRIESIVRALGQMRAKGKVSSQEMMQLTEAGIPAWDMLAKILGTDVAGAMQKVESGAIQSAQVLPRLIDELGKFGNGRMAAQAKTLVGRFSNLKDAFWEAVTPLGEALLPYAGKLLTIVSKLVDDIGGWIKANAAVAVKLSLVALTLMSLGAAAIGAAFAIRGATFVIGALGIAIRVMLLPARLAVVLFNGLAQVFTGVLAFGARAATAAIGVLSIALRTVAASATLTAATIRGFAATIAAGAAVLRTISLATYGAAAATTFFGAALQLTKRITASTAVAVRVVAGALGLFTFATRLAAMGVVAAAGLVRLAGAVFATFGVIVNATALALSGIGTVLMLFGNPLGGVLFAIAAIGAAIYYARGVSINFGAALDWLKDRFGPLAEQALAAFGVIKDAIMAGDWKTAASLLWSGLQAAFLRGKVELLKIWDDLTSGFRTGWQETMAGLTGMWIEWKTVAEAAAHDAYAALVRARAAFARLIGKDELANAMDLEAQAEASIATNLRRMAPKLGERAIQESLNASAKSDVDRDALRRQQETEAAAAERAFAAATEAAKAAAGTANAAANEAVTPTSSSETPSTQTAKAAAVTAKPAINTAAILGTTAAQEAVLKALGGSAKGITPGARLVAEAIDRFNAAEARRHREAMKNSGFFKVEKV